MVHVKCMLARVEGCVCGGGGGGGVSVFVFNVKSGSLQITSHYFNMVLLPSELPSVLDVRMAYASS